MVASVWGNIMNLTAFLEQVTPSQGYLIVATPYDMKGRTKSAPMQHFASQDQQAILSKVAEWDFDHKDVFYALAGFKEERVWNPTAKNSDGSVGKWQQRTQANAGWMRCLFLDLDVDADPDERKAGVTFLSKDEAVRALRAVCRTIGMPKPMLVDSGGGIHAYWPFDDDVTVDQWKPLAERFKSILLAEKLKIDPAVPADSARVLRPIGTHNMKRTHARRVTLVQEAKGAYPFQSFHTLFDIYEQHNGVVAVAKPRTPRPAPASGASGLLAGGGLSDTVDPIDFGSIMFHCAAVGGQVANRGATASEPLWFAMLGLAKFAVGDPVAAMKVISEQHPEYDEAIMLAKADGWNAGPTTCAKISSLCSDCQSCPFFGTITSPAQLGKHKEGKKDIRIELVDETTGLMTTVPVSSAPFPYLVRDGEVMREESLPDGTKDFVTIAPCAMYPLRILRSMTGGAPVERSVWRITQQLDDDLELTIQHSWLADRRQMGVALANSGSYMSGKQGEEVVTFMSAYLKKLAGEMKRERVFDRLGWVGDTHSEGFVVNGVFVEPAGSIRQCSTTQHVQSCTKEKMKPTGSFQAWDDAMRFYDAPNYAGHRFFLYLALGAPLFHMTGYNGMIINAVGASGRGKTTCLHACSTIWGAFDSLIINGNPHGSTNNALGNLMGTFHSLPVLLDEITERNEEEMAEFFLNVSQGRGKERMKGNEHDGRTVTWETPVLTTANSDMIARVMATQKNATQHVMRAVGVDFSLIDTSPGAVQKANSFIRTLKEHHGHAGIAFMRYVVQNYAAVKAYVEQGIDRIFAQINGTPEERYWVAAIAVAYTAAEIAQKIGFWGSYPIKQDLQWMKHHVSGMRAVVRDGVTTPAEALGEFLNENLPGTLVLSQKIASSVDNIAVRPRSELVVRTELDAGMAVVSKQALRNYCLTNKLNFREIEDALSSLNIIIERNKLRTLGSGTPYATGQIRCWVVDIRLLDPNYLTTVTNAVTAQGSNVVPLQKTGT